MTLWTFCQSVLLVFNAFAVLNEQRFLEKYGLGHSSLTSGYVAATSPRGQLIGLITATTYMRSASLLFSSIRHTGWAILGDDTWTSTRTNAILPFSCRGVRPPSPAGATRPARRAERVCAPFVALVHLTVPPLFVQSPLAVPLVVLNSLVIFVKMIFG